MNIFQRLRLFFARDIDKYFKSSRRLYVPMVKGGMWVDHETALSLAAVFGAVRYVSESLASLPWELRQRKRGGGSDPAPSHIVYRLLHRRPNSYMSAFDWKVLMVARANLWGNGYAEIEHDSMNRPIALWPIASDRVTPKINDDVGLYYEVTQRNTEKKIFYPEDIFHLRGLGDEKEGYSVVALAARSIGAGLAADEFAASFYENSAVTSGVLRHPKALGDKAYDRLKEEIKDKKQGPRNAWHPWILEEGMEWETMTMPLKDAQFLESRKFTVNEIARWFRVPPHKIADLDRATFSNIEHQSIEVVQDTIIPWAMRLEQEADYKLIGARNRSVFYSKMNVKGLLRGDSKARAEFYRIMRNIGTMNGDEIRDLEDMNPIPGGAGKKYVMQGQYTTLDKIGEEQEIAPQLDVPKEEEEGEEEKEKETKAAWRMVFHNALERIYDRKTKRLEDARKNIDQGKWEAWLEKFKQDHAQYSVKALRTIYFSYAKAIGFYDAGILEIALNSFAEAEEIEKEQTKEDLWNLAGDIQDQIQSLEIKESNYAITSTA